MKAMGGQVVDLSVSPAYVESLLDNRGEAYETLRSEGFVFGGISTKRTVILDSLRSAAVVAMESRDYELCESIIEVLKKHDHV